MPEMMLNQDVPVLLKENETIRRASQYSGTEFGLTSEGLLSHGDNSPDVGLHKMLLPQYKNHIESSGHTDSRMTNLSSKLA